MSIIVCDLHAISNLAIANNYIYYYSLDEEVDSGQIVISLHDGIIPYIQKEDLCQGAGNSCPLEPGKQTISLSTPIPSIAPKVRH